VDPRGHRQPLTRVERSCALLERGDLAVDQVAAAAGFGSTSSDAAAPADRLGNSPRAYHATFPRTRHYPNRDGIFSDGMRRVDGEDEFTHQMRVISYLHLTRFVRILLDRKDRISMAARLEVRVPFCDHRLVEYVYNTPWSMKNYNG
jgi:hypothetical protein